MPIKTRWTSRDKVYHLIGGFVLFLIFQNLLPVIAIGLVKEIVDEINYGGFDYKDFLTTIAGGVIGIGIINLLWMIG
jgi:hypothetical protein